MIIQRTLKALSLLLLLTRKHTYARRLKKPQKPTEPPVGPEICSYDNGESVRLWTLEEVRRTPIMYALPSSPLSHHIRCSNAIVTRQVASNTSYCNMVFYDKVYHLDEFIPIHKGGSEPMIRNCGKDATWLFENLQCIAMVPDHFEGMLNMCHNYIVGVLKDSYEDPCANDPWTEPEYPYPDFAACDVYDNITCTSLEFLPNNGPNNGAWNAEMVATEQALYPPIDLTDWDNMMATQHCYTILHGWVYDFAQPPLDGSDPFFKKHGNGLYPQAILKHCGSDMTIPFDDTVDQARECVPDHTLGGMNVLSGYVVGVIEDSEADPCLWDQVPDTPCQALTDDILEGELEYFTASNFVDSGVACPVVILDKVYDLTDFAPFHWGGENQIDSVCFRDATKRYLSKRSHHPRIHLGSIQRLQIGVIQDGITDACSPNYDEERDF